MTVSRAAEASPEEKGLVFDIQRFSIHDGPGIRTCVFLKGCPLRCAWCSNPESQGRQPELMWDRRSGRSTTVGDWMTVDEVMAVVLRDKDYYEHSGGGMTLSGGEFMIQPEFSLALIEAAHRQQITVVGETSGLAQPAVFSSIVDQLDFVMMDVKHYDPMRHVEVTRARLPLILQNAAYLENSRTPHVFRIPVIPGVNDTPDDAEGFAEMLTEYGITAVELVPFHQYGKGKYADLDRPYGFEDSPSLTPEDLTEFRSRLESHGVTASISD
ncbi:MAG: radical SAM protein [Actinobacteria bacterium]|nr:radical SAM protein [Actinomycetota bacterium]